MDPILIGISVLTKLITLGLKASEAASSEGFDAKDVEAIKALLDAGGETVKLYRRGDPSLASYQIALTTRAFGLALARHRVTRAPEKEVALRVRQAIETPLELGERRASVGEVEELAALTGTPTNSAYYRNLWAAFTSARPVLAAEDIAPLIDVAERREFELHFLLAYWNGLGSSAGGFIARHQATLEAYRRHRVLELLIADTATWGRRHVFGNLDRGGWELSQEGQIPFLPLDEMYVEPFAGQVRVLPALRSLLLADRESRVVVVRADFGHGKSLTARKLASMLAREYLESPAPGLDLFVPVFIKCAEDFAGDTFQLEATVRRAWKRQAESFRLSLGESDAGFGLPAGDQRVVFILDGLDEVLLGGRSIDHLFATLGAGATERRRFVVFSRHGVVPHELEKRNGFRVLDLSGLSPDAQDEWLARWCRLSSLAAPITRAQIAARGLEELAETPILLLMIGMTWDQGGTSGEKVPRAVLYEGFFRELARGKHERDRDRNEPVFRAGEELLAHLRVRGELDEDADASAAMLWVMARVAWEGERLAWRRPPADLAGPRKPLSRHAVERLLTDELELPREVAATIQIGLLLAMQADLRGGDDQILFGHKSFREFLIGRYWADQLLRLVRGPQHEWTRPGALLGARLLAQEDRSFDFLMEIVNLSWTDRDRNELVNWAQYTFNDESQIFAGRSTSVRDDLRPPLREAALAIGSTVKGSIGLQAKDEATLRTLVGWFWTINAPMRLIAPRLRTPKAILGRAVLKHAQFDEADLSDADLSFAELAFSSFERAHLERARFLKANVEGASFENAALHEAWFAFVNLFGGSLVGAQARNANFNGADLNESALGGADLSGCQLVQASLRGANLEHAKLAGAELQFANLEGANLAGAVLDGAKLTHVRGYPPPKDG